MLIFFFTNALCYCVDVFGKVDDGRFLCCQNCEKPFLLIVIDQLIEKTVDVTWRFFLFFSTKNFSTLKVLRCAKNKASVCFKEGSHSR